jgi:hypothetical protein
MRDARELSDVWDAWSASADEPDLLSTAQLRDIRPLLQASRANATLTPQRQAQIWDQVLAGAVDVWQPTVSARTSPDKDQRFQAAPAIESRWSLVTRWAWVILAGFAGGAIAGFTSRILMRLSGVMTPQENRFRLTENEARVGLVTADGTLFLVIAGGALGIVALLIYLAIRPRLPFSGWRRSLTFGALLLLVFGYVIMRPGNPDYHLFGPAWINVITFCSLYVVMGFCTAQIYEWGGQATMWPERVRAHRFSLGAIRAGSLLIGILGIVPILLSLVVGLHGLLIPVVALGVGLALRAVRTNPLCALQIPPLVSRWAVVVIPGIVGFALTARGVIEILMQ